MFDVNLSPPPSFSGGCSCDQKETKHDLICYFWLVWTSFVWVVQVQHVLLKAASVGQRTCLFLVSPCWMKSRCVPTSEGAERTGWMESGSGREGMVGMQERMSNDDGTEGIYSYRED